MTERNNLFPVFLKLSNLHVLVVGGGNVAIEKLHFLFKSSPDAKVTLVAREVRDEIYNDYHNFDIQIIQKTFEPDDLKEKNIVIAATDDSATNEFVRISARERNVLVNVADKPALCDFYLGSIVTKGDLKIAISTNGKAPSFASKFRSLLEEILPDSIPEILNNLQKIRKSLKGDFETKAKKLKEITSVLHS